jgi:hypothetical protein
LRAFSAEDDEDSLRWRRRRSLPDEETESEKEPFLYDSDEEEDEVAGRTMDSGGRRRRSWGSTRPSVKESTRDKTGGPKLLHEGFVA